LFAAHASNACLWFVRQITVQIVVQIVVQITVAGGVVVFAITEGNVDES
jgi:hypothetical protein